MSTFTIGTVARRSGMSVETIRFYERLGIIPAPVRRPGGRYRQYGEDVIARLAFIRQAKALGFSLPEIGELLALSTDPDATCEDVRRRARVRLTDVETRIDRLQHIQHALRRLIADCRGDGPVAECPILEALGTEHEAGRGH